MDSLSHSNAREQKARVIGMDKLRSPFFFPRKYEPPSTDPDQPDFATRRVP